MKTVDFLDAVKRRHGLSSDYRLAKFLRWPTQRISVYRGGRRELDDAGCVQIAEALELPPAYVLACIAATRAKSDELARYWREAAKLLKTGTAAVILATTLMLEQPAPSPSEVHASMQADCLYIMRRRHRERWRAERRRRRRRTPRRAIVSATNLLSGS